MSAKADRGFAASWPHRRRDVIRRTVAQPRLATRHSQGIHLHSIRGPTLQIPCQPRRARKQSLAQFVWFQILESLSNKCSTLFAQSAASKARTRHSCQGQSLCPTSGIQFTQIKPVVNGKFGTLTEPRALSPSRLLTRTTLPLPHLHTKKDLNKISQSFGTVSPVGKNSFDSNFPTTARPSLQKFVSSSNHGRFSRFKATFWHLPPSNQSSKDANTWNEKVSLDHSRPNELGAGSSVVSGNCFFAARLLSQVASIVQAVVYAAFLTCTPRYSNWHFLVVHELDRLRAQSTNKGCCIGISKATPRCHLRHNSPNVPTPTV